MKRRRGAAGCKRKATLKSKRYRDEDSSDSSNSYFEEEPVYSPTNSLELSDASAWDPLKVDVKEEGNELSPKQGISKTNIVQPKQNINNAATTIQMKGEYILFKYMSTLIFVNNTCFSCLARLQ